MSAKFARRILAIGLATATLWATVVTAGSETLSAAVDAIQESAPLPQHFLRWELGDFSAMQFSAATLITLRQSPFLMAQRSGIAAMKSQTAESGDVLSVPDQPEQETVSEPDSEPDTDVSLTDGLEFRENGVPSQTVHPTSERGYTVINGVHIKNSSSCTLDTEALSAMDFSARPGEDGPQILIIHSHGSESYSMPPGEEYTATGTYRTDDDRCNVLRVGDEVASVLSSHGLSVLHDRTLHDVPTYNESYSRSLAAMQSYLSQYPSLRFILDIHRDAISDADGNQYKLIAEEEPRAAQVCFVMGSSYDGFEDNLKLAIAVQHRITQEYPTLMRPITLRGYRYNQQLTRGSMLVEIGSAGNSMDEALLSARIFAENLAETILEA